MIPILFETNGTDFTSNGIGRLTDAISCVITQNNEGTYELEMVYPITGIYANEITNNRCIYAKPERGKGNQPFIIRNIEKTIDGKMKITARHKCYDLSYYACLQFGKAENLPYKYTPSLYDSQEHLIGILTEYTSLEVVVENTKWVMTLKYPVNGTYASYIIPDNYIYAQPKIGRELVMFDITFVDIGATEITVTAKATKVPRVPSERNMMTVIEALGNVSSHTEAIQHCPFTFSVDPIATDDTWVTEKREFWSDMPKPMKQLLFGSEGSILDIFGGEWEFDHDQCILHEERGNDNGVEYRYGKNITDITERINIDEIYTHAFSFWKGTESSSTNTEDGEYYTLLGNNITILNEKYAEMFPYQRTLAIDASSEFEEEPTVAKLDKYTRKYVKDNSSGTPQVTINVSIVDLAGTKEYEDIAALEQVNLYDKVTIVFPDFGIKEKAKVTEIKFDVLKEKNDDVTIGDVTTNLSNIIAKNKTDIVRTKYNLQHWADKAIERATEAIAGWYGGNIRKNYNKNDHKQQSMYIMDSDDEDSARGVVQMNSNGISVGRGGTGGSYTPMVGIGGGNTYFSDKYAIDGDTNASFLKRGTITSGTSYWNIESGAAELTLISLTVTGSSHLNVLTTTGSATFQNGIVVTGISTFNNSVTFNDAVTFNDNAEFGVDVKIVHNLELGNIQDVESAISSLQGSIGNVSGLESRVSDLENRVQDMKDLMDAHGW